MVWTLWAVGSTVVESLPGSAATISKACSHGECRPVPYRKPASRPGQVSPLGTSFVDCWGDWRIEARAILGTAIHRRSRRQRKDRKFMVVDELAGQYEDGFDDVKVQILNYFTYKAARTVLHQLYEMNPTHYRWLYDFLVTNNPGGDGKRFLRSLAKERQDLAERVMVTRLHLYGKWAKKCDHAEMYKEISEENLELMRERLMETVIWPADDTNTEKIG